MAVNEENSCAFYASDYHLEMIMLPYINRNIVNNKKTYIFTQDNLEETINSLIEKVNLPKEIKQNILNINWKNEDKNKYQMLIEQENDAMIFIKGNKDYIEKTNKNLQQLNNYKNMQIVDCYNLEELGSETKEIAKCYKSYLTTLGK